MRPKILHVITGLDMGGAESMLLKLSRHAIAAGRDWEVVSIGPAGDLTPAFLGEKVPVTHLGAEKVAQRIGRISGLMLARDRRGGL